MNFRFFCSITKGDFVSITGPSGSGKTTLLLALSGLIRPTSGNIIFENQHLENASDKELAEFRKKHVGFVMQNFSLILYMTAIQNVMIPLGNMEIQESTFRMESWKIYIQSNLK